MNSFYPYVDETTLRASFLERVALLTSDRNNLLPAWAREDGGSLLQSRKFMVCGSISRSEIRVLAKVADVVAIVDDYLSAKQSTLFGIPVITTDKWIERVSGDTSIVSCVLVPGTKGYEHFMKLCLQFDIRHLGPLEFLQLIRLNKVDTKGETGRFFWYGYEFFESTVLQAEKLLQVCGNLGDSFSRISWLCVLMYRLTLNPFYLTFCAVGHHFSRFGWNSYSCNRQFFRFSDNEVYVDGGAFTGYTIEQFLRTVGGQFRHIHAFEPLAENRRAVSSRLSGLQAEYLMPLAPRISIHKEGLWDSRTTLLFNPTQTIDSFGDAPPVNTQSAHMIDSKILEHLYDRETEKSVAIEVPVITIDEATDAKATFIKLEIEGAELEALNGAKQTIHQNRPQMALSIYHKPEDLVTITDFVASTGIDYKLGFRLHNPLAPDAMVLYCYRRG